MTRIWIRHALTLLAALVAATVLFPSPVPPAYATYGTLIGRVLDSATGKGAFGIPIQLYRPQDGRLVLESQGWTGVNGSFALDGAGGSQLAGNVPYAVHASPLAGLPQQFAVLDPASPLGHRNLWIGTPDTLARGAAPSLEVTGGAELASQIWQADWLGLFGPPEWRLATGPDYKAPRRAKIMGRVSDALTGAYLNNCGVDLLYWTGSGWAVVTDITAPYVSPSGGCNWAKESPPLYGPTLFALRSWAYAYPPVYSGATTDPAGLVPFWVTPGETVRQDTSLNAPNRITGRVYESTTGRAIADAAVTLWHYDPAARTWSQPTAADTRPDGTYVLPGYAGVAAGTYRIAVFDRHLGYGQVFYGGSTTLAGARDIVVAQGSTVTGIDVPMGPRPVLRGRVLRQGTPASDVQVTSFMFDPAHGSWAWQGEAFTDSRGEWSMGSAGRAQVRVLFTDLSGSSASSVWYQNKDLWTRRPL